MLWQQRAALKERLTASLLRHRTSIFSRDRNDGLMGKRIGD